MRNLTILLVVCAATAATSAQANGQSAAVQAACAQDAQKFCSGVQSGGGRIVACLKQNKDSLSDGCRQAAGLPAKPVSSPPPSATSSPADSVSAPSVPAAPSPAKPATTTKGTSAKAASVKAASATSTEKFVEHVILDPQHSGMRAATIHLPEKWTFESTMQWHYNWIEYPFTFSSHAENPANAEAYFEYPLIRVDFLDVPPQLKQYDKSPKLAPGQRGPNGAYGGPPQPPVQALQKFIQSVRPNVANLKWLGQQDLPGLAKVLQMDSWPGAHGVAIKIGYDLNGQPVEEAFFGVYYISQGANAGTNAGMIKQTNWGFVGLQSFRAPAGTLDQRMPMFCVIAKSLYVNPEWARLSKAITDKMNADFAQKLKEGDDQLRAAQAIMQQTMQQQAAFQANFDKQEQAFRSSGGVDDSYLRDGGARSAADKWDDVIRGVDTVNDPSPGGTTQLSNLGQYHFTDGFGNYRTTDDPNYTPEKDGEVGSWTPMTAAR
jgi:Cysteine rich repeat